MCCFLPPSNHNHLRFIPIWLASTSQEDLTVSPAQIPQITFINTYIEGCFPFFNHLTIMCPPRFSGKILYKTKMTHRHPVNLSCIFPISIFLLSLFQQLRMSALLYFLFLNDGWKTGVTKTYCTITRGHGKNLIPPNAALLYILFK